MERTKRTTKAPQRLINEYTPKTTKTTLNLDVPKVTVKDDVVDEK